LLAVTKRFRFSEAKPLSGDCYATHWFIGILRYPQPVKQYGQLPRDGDDRSASSILSAVLG
jgi:hypothetical protein